MPPLRYGPTVVQTTRALRASSAGSSASATISGRSIPSASSFARERPASAMSASVLSRYSATSRPTNPVAPKTTMSCTWWTLPGHAGRVTCVDRLDELERQVEGGNLFAHSALTEHAGRLNEAAALMNGLVGLLIQRGLVDGEELLGIVESAREAAEETGQHATLGVMVRKDRP